ncbi:pentatricopeptide repeat-containing protein At3g04760, chloroplastic isoform X4 [Amaranthus tricolor]|uniref:pentatricopeptide repeat-containing protein At3g04760, chloroplastic isoform X4 n=1 Tax=Amaranthus tricolor TaxID=29722 RepID=UPI00258A98BA|nr:pentatricopeptide repeat-containing protein At3g04760, chloroplastic isoform X4 [Amaranthus tricolor]
MLCSSSRPSRPPSVYLYCSDAARIANVQPPFIHAADHHLFMSPPSTLMNVLKIVKWLYDYGCGRHQLNLVSRIMFSSGAVEAFNCSYKLHCLLCRRAVSGRYLSNCLFTRHSSAFADVQLCPRSTDSSSDALTFSSARRSGDGYSYIDFEDPWHKLSSYGVIDIPKNFKREPTQEHRFQHNVNIYVSITKRLCSRGSTRKLEALFLDVIKSNKEELGFDIPEFLDIFLENLELERTNSMVKVADVLVKVYVSMGMFDQCIDVLFQTQRHGILPSILTCNYLLNQLIQQDKLDMAVATYQQLKRMGLNPNIYTYNLMIKAFCRMGHLKEAVNFFLEMEKAGVIPNEYSYTTYIEALCSFNKSDAAYELLKACRDSGVISYGFSYEVVVQGFCNENKLSEAETVLLDMENQGGLARNGYEEEILHCLDYVKGQGLTPDTVMHNKIIEGLCIGGKVKEAEKFLYSLDNKCPDNYSAMIDGYCEAKLAREAFSLFVNLKKHGTPLKRKTSLNLLSCLCMNGEVDSAFVLFETFLVLEDNLCIKIPSKLMTALCNSGDIEKARRVFDIWVDRGFIPDVVMYTIMMNGYCKANSILEAWKLAIEMKDRGIEPDVITLTALLDGFLKSSLNKSDSDFNISLGEKAKKFESIIRSKMSEMQLKPDLAWYTVLIDKCCKVNDIEEAMVLFHDLIDKGLRPDVVTYTTLLSGCCRVRDKDRALMLVNLMTAHGLQPDQIAKSALKRAIFNNIRTV